MVAALLLGWSTGCSIDTAGLGGFDAAVPANDAFAPRLDAPPAAMHDGAPGPDVVARSDGGPGDDGALPGDDAGPTPPTGCVPAAWTVAFTDDFSGGLSGWDVDGNVDGSSTFWRVEGGRLHGHSTDAGADVVVHRTETDVAVVARLDINPRAGATGMRAAGPLVRADSIDFSENRFYACLVDTSVGEVVLARFDDASSVSSGQGFTELGRGAAAIGAGAFDVILCAERATISCDVPSVGLHVEASDAMFGAGWPGLRVMRADAFVESFTVYAP